MKVEKLIVKLTENNSKTKNSSTINKRTTNNWTFFFVWFKFQTYFEFQTRRNHKDFIHESAVHRIWLWMRMSNMQVVLYVTVFFCYIFFLFLFCVNGGVWLTYVILLLCVLVRFFLVLKVFFSSSSLSTTLLSCDLYTFRLRTYTFCFSTSYSFDGRY